MGAFEDHRQEPVRMAAMRPLLEHRARHKRFYTPVSRDEPACCGTGQKAEKPRPRLGRDERAALRKEGTNALADEQGNRDHDGSHLERPGPSSGIDKQSQCKRAKRKNDIARRDHKASAHRRSLAPFAFARSHSRPSNKVQGRLRAAGKAALARTKGALRTRVRSVPPGLCQPTFRASRDNPRQRPLPPIHRAACRLRPSQAQGWNRCARRGNDDGNLRRR